MTYLVELLNLIYTLLSNIPYSLQLRRCVLIKLQADFTKVSSPGTGGEINDKDLCEFTEILATVSYHWHIYLTRIIGHWVQEYALHAVYFIRNLIFDEGSALKPPGAKNCFDILKKSGKSK